MLLDLLRALCAATAAVVLPGYFWAALLRPGGGLAERLGYSSALSLATVPVVALVLARLAGRVGVTAEGPYAQRQPHRAPGQAPRSLNRLYLLQGDDPRRLRHRPIIAPGPRTGATPAR